MWIASVIIKHDCLIGNKCEKYKVSTVSVPFNLYIEGNTTYSPEFHTLWGEEKNIERFIAALRRDKHIHNIETDGNKIFLVEVTDRKLPVTIRGSLQQKILWTKPIQINTKGEERWEIASWDKSYITKFIEQTRKISKYVILEWMKQTMLKDVYHTRLLPQLSSKQKEAVTLALAEGYYDWPKRTDFKALARRMGVSVPTYREHLKKAEKKLLPELISQL